jgi:hypothetical protein
VFRMWVWKMQHLVLILQNIVLVVLIMGAACPVGLCYMHMVWRNKIEEAYGEEETTEETG